MLIAGVKLQKVQFVACVSSHTHRHGYEGDNASPRQIFKMCSRAPPRSAVPPVASTKSTLLPLTDSRFSTVNSPGGSPGLAGGSISVQEGVSLWVRHTLSGGGSNQNRDPLSSKVCQGALAGDAAAPPAVQTARMWAATH